MGSTHTNPAATPVAELILLGGFELRCRNDMTTVPLAAQRVLASLALSDRPLQRSTLATQLWPRSHRQHTSGNLRSALWRVRRVSGTELIDSHGPLLTLAPGVRVDIRDKLSLARRIVSGEHDEYDMPADPQTLMQFSMRLLPEWPDEWLIVDRERWDQLRLHALEMLAERLMASQRHVLAVEAALIAVAIEPIRESAHRTLMRAYMAEGNWGNAIEQYRRYRRLLERELGVGPTAHMEDLVRELTSSQRSTAEPVLRSIQR